MSSLMWELDSIARCATQYRTEMLAPLGLKSCHASYLLHICADPGICQEQLAQRIFFNKSSVARQLAALEEVGFIRRCTCSADRRVTRVYPTDKAMEALPQIQKVLADWEAIVTADFTPETLDCAMAVLRKLKERAAHQIQEE